jgi:glycyl-tRNA synthetase beta chain
MTTSPTAELLLEIGCEELPAPWLSGLRQQFRQRFLDAATRDHLEPAEVEVYSTPRRLALFAELRARQDDREERVWGPSLKVARDAKGAWTGAASGFARKHATVPEALATSAKDPSAPEELYLLFVRQTPGRPALEVLPGVLAATLRGLAFPKRMSWDAWLDDGKGAFPFGRPIRWIVALLDGVVVPFTIYELVAGARGPVLVESGNATRGHRFLPRGAAGRPLAVAGATAYRARLREACVVLDPAEREVQIREGLAAAGEVREDHGLIEEWRELVEHPTVVAGGIPPEFATLPTEVLETVLVHHQKYIPLLGDGQQVHRFAALTGSDETASQAIVRGMERVVVARLRDAAFFFAEDMKRPLADRVADLEGVTFHQKLGSYREKAERLAHLVDAMGAALGLLTKPEHKAAREAALLAKADLTTLMVREFPELQGVMGGIYLRAQGGAWENVAAAVRWHYHPISVEEHSQPFPSQVGDSNVFGAVSLADKLDTLAGYFGIGLQPTGSSDPCGLRRAAQGVIRVLLDFWTADAAEGRPSLARLASAAVAGYAGRLARPPAEVVSELQTFLLERLRSVLVARGYPADEVEAALGAREPDALEDPHEAWVRLQALHRVRSEAREDFERLAVAFKRARNILEGAQAGQADPALLSEDAERGLHAAIAGLAGGGGDYEARLRALAGLRSPVDRFFDDVLVMAEDPVLRANRLGLLTQAVSLFYRIADISRLGG